MRTFLYLLLLGSAIYFLTTYPSEISFKWGGYQVDTYTFIALPVILLIGTAVTAFIHGLASAIDVLPILRGYWQRKKQAQAHDLLYQSMIYYYTDDTAQAAALAARALEVVPNLPTALWILAKALPLKDPRRTRALEDLRKTPLSKIAIVEEISRVIKAEDLKRAHTLIKAQLRQTPDDAWLLGQAFQCALGLGHIKEAESSLEKWAKKVRLPKVELRRQQSKILLMQATQALSHPDLADEVYTGGLLTDVKIAPKKDAFDLFVTALDLDPTNLDTLEQTVMQGIAQNIDASKILKLILKTWETAPHPRLLGLALHLAKTTHPDKSVLELFDKMTAKKIKPDDVQQTLWLSLHRLKAALLDHDDQAIRQIVPSLAGAPSFRLTAMPTLAEVEAILWRLYDAVF